MANLARPCRFQGSVRVNGRIAAVVLAGAVALAWWLLRTQDSSGDAQADSARVGVSPQTHQSEPSPAPARAVARRLERLKEVRRKRLARAPVAAAPDTTERCEDSCWGTIGMQVALAGVVSGCREELAEEARGQARFRAHVLAEPGMDAVIESVEVLDDSIGVEAFIECVVESAPLGELEDPGAPVSDDFVFRYTAGPPRNPANEFLSAHPELAAGKPLLATLAERDPTQRPSSEEATGFAQWITEDAAAQAAFTAWVAEQGIDIANVKVD